MQMFHHLTRAQTNLAPTVGPTAMGRGSLHGPHDATGPTDGPPTVPPQGPPQRNATRPPSRAPPGLTPFQTKKHEEE